MFVDNSNSSSYSKSRGVHSRERGSVHSRDCIINTRVASYGAVTASIEEGASVSTSSNFL